MRALWKGSVAFGLVSVPVKLYAATEDHDVRFHQVHAEDGGRIRMKRQCEVCGRQLSYTEIAKGYEDASGQRLIIDPDDLESLPVPGGRDIDVVEFVPNEQIDPILFDRCYYLEPESRALKPYVLLREALKETERTALVKVAIRQRTQLACLRIRDDVLVLQTMKWPDEVREADFDVLETEVDLRPQELAMAQSLIETMAGDFDPGDYEDEYREALIQLIEAKLAGGKGIPMPDAVADEGGAQVVDLMAALRESVARSQAARADDDEAAVPSASGGAAVESAARGGGTRKRAAAKGMSTAGKSTAAKSNAGRATAAKSSAKSAARKTTTGKAARKKTTAGKAPGGRTSAGKAAAKSPGGKRTA